MWVRSLSASGCCGARWLIQYREVRCGLAMTNADGNVLLGVCDEGKKLIAE
jgi:hypothetical protein